MAVRIIAMPNGTWDTIADIVTLTEEQYERLANGETSITSLYAEGVEAESIQMDNEEQ